MTWFSGREVGRWGWMQEGEGGETVRSALVVASHTPRGHPVPIRGRRLRLAAIYGDGVWERSS